MKRVDISDKVMEKVVRYERRRVWRWAGAFLAVFLIGLALVIGSLYVLARQLFEKEVASLLDLYIQDKELLGLLWRDAVSFIWEALPHNVVYFAGFIIVIGIILLMATRRKRRILLRRIREMRTRQTRT